MKRTQIAQRSVDQDAPLLLKFRINNNYTNNIKDILDVRNRSRKEEYELTKRRVKEVGIDEAFVYDRVDSTGVKQGDTGTEMFANGKPGNAVTFVNFISDLRESHYNIIDVYSYQKDGDRMSFIVFVFNKKTSAGFPSRVTCLLKKLAAKSWEHVHIWNNPNGSITINAAHIMQDTAQPIRMGRTNGKKQIPGVATTVEIEGVYFTIG